MGRFCSSPIQETRSSFRRADRRAPGNTIQPGLMYTDGGSIPKVAQVFKGLSPWGYAPAYMIHDWMFVARHCIVDGSSDKRFQQVRDVDFDQSATILGEAIKASGGRGTRRSKRCRSQHHHRCCGQRRREAVVGEAWCLRGAAGQRKGHRGSRSCHPRIDQGTDAQNVQASRGGRTGGGSRARPAEIVSRVTF